MTNTSVYIGVLVPGGSSTNGDKNKKTNINCLENSGLKSGNTGEIMEKSVNTGENIQKSGNIMHTKASIDNIRSIRGKNISTIRDFNPLFPRKATFAQQENCFHNSADMQFRNATQDFELKEKISADRSAEIKEKDQIIAELRKQISTAKIEAEIKKKDKVIAELRKLIQEQIQLSRAKKTS